MAHWTRCSAAVPALLLVLALSCAVMSSEALRCNRTSPVLDPSHLCDGVRDCSSGADEDPTFCARFNCSLGGMVRCPDSKIQCIDPFYLCDGTPNCPNGTDEKRRTCKNFPCDAISIKCPGSGVCIGGGAYCNGVPDCPKNHRGIPADEVSKFCRRFKCPAGHVKCADRRQCIPENRLCDSVKDCLDGSDERPTLCSKFDCKKNGRLRCPTGGRCLPDPCMVCDCIKDCHDGSDELKKYCSLRNTTLCGAPYPCYNNGFR